MLLACLLCGAVAAAVAPPAHAQAVRRFQARVVHADTDAPVAGAIVTVAGAIGTARTDEQGRFTWAPVPPVPFQLIVVLPGGQVAPPVTIEDVRSDIAVVVITAFREDAVAVVGVGPSISSTPAAAATVVSGRHIAQRSAEHLAQALETIPGVSQVSEGHAAVPAVRGLARGRTVLLIDGARVLAERRTGPGATFLDPAVIERVDVSRGPGAVAYGSDAFGGVISVRTRRPEFDTALAVRSSVTLGAGVPHSRAAVELSKGFARSAWLASAHARNAEDYDAAAGPVFNSGWQDRGVLLGSVHRIGTGVLTAVLQSDSGTDIGRPRTNSRTVRFFYPFEHTHRFTSSLEIERVAGFRQIEVTAFVGSHRQRTDQERFATSGSGRRLERADTDSRDFELKAAAHRLLGATRVQLGAAFTGRRLQAFDYIEDAAFQGAPTAVVMSTSVENARRMDAGAYVVVESTLSRALHVAAGVRGDRVTTRNSGGFFGSHATTTPAASGFAALTLAPYRGFSLTTQVSRGFRDSMLSDRYFRGPTGRGFITGNPALEPENSVQLDVSARYGTSRTQVGIYAYDYRIHRFIERFQTEPDFFFFRNGDMARLRGLELEATSTFGRGFSGALGASLARGVSVSGRLLDDVAPPTFSLVGRKQFGVDAYLQTRLLFLARDGRPGPNEVATPAATLLDIGAGLPLSRKVALSGLVRNVLDASYPSSPDPRGVPAPARSVSLTSSVRF